MSYSWWFRNPANQLDMVNISPLFVTTGFFQRIPGGFLGSQVLGIKDRIQIGSSNTRTFDLGLHQQ